MFAENINELLNALSEKFNSEACQIRLAHKTKWDSLISYPISLNGKKLFKLVGNIIVLENDALQYIEKFTVFSNSLQFRIK